MSKYKVMVGVHYSKDGGLHKQGSVVVSDLDLVKLYPNKFVKVGQASDSKDSIKETPAVAVKKEPKPASERVEASAILESDAAVADEEDVEEVEQPVVLRRRKKISKISKIKKSKKIKG